MRAWESAKDGTASQHDKTAKVNRTAIRRVHICHLPRLPVILLEHLLGPLVVNKSMSGEEVGLGHPCLPERSQAFRVRNVWRSRRTPIRTHTFAVRWGSLDLLSPRSSRGFSRARDDPWSIWQLLSGIIALRCWPAQSFAVPWP